MSSPNRPHYSANTLRLSERFQKATGAAGRMATWAVAGSSSPAYLQLQWDTVSSALVDSDAWVRFPGNPDASRLMRRWRTAFLLSMKCAELEVIKYQHPDAVPAVAIRNDDLVQLGTHDELQFGQLGKDRQAVAGREGGGPVDVVAGLYLAAEARLVVPESLTENGIRIMLSEFQEPALSQIQVF